MSIQLGQPIPDFTANATNNTIFTLDKIKGKNCILFFYPKDNTPGCTTEGLAFKESYEQFSNANTYIFGISKDSIASHEKFKKKYEFPFELISDPNETLCQLFDVIQLKKLYGKEYMGIERSTFLIDKQGVLQKQWRKVKVNNHVQEVLEATLALI